MNFSLTPRERVEFIDRLKNAGKRSADDDESDCEDRSRKPRSWSVFHRWLWKIKCNFSNYTLPWVPSHKTLRIPSRKYSVRKRTHHHKGSVIDGAVKLKGSVFKRQCIWKAGWEQNPCARVIHNSCKCPAVGCMSDANVMCQHGKYWKQLVACASIQAFCQVAYGQWKVCVLHQ